MYKAMLMGMLGIFLFYRICYANQDILSIRTFLGKQLILIGTHTLPIYLLHYFFFLGMKMPDIGEWLSKSDGRWWMATLLTAVITIIVIYSSIYVGKIIHSISPMFYKYMLGK